MIEPPYYVIDICGLTGEVIERIDNPISLVATRGYNTKGVATIELPRDWDRNLFKWNTRLKIWRVARNYKHNLFGDTIWFIKKFRNLVSQDMYVLELEDAFSILDTRLVAYTSQTPYADKTLEEFGLVSYTNYFRIDNLMKQYVRENLGSAALDYRRRNSYIEVEANQNLASHAEKQAAWTQLSAVLSDLAATSEAEGLPIFYDLLPKDDGSFLFRTWTEVRGVDRGITSANPLVLAEDNSELDDVEITDDFSNVGTLCYVLGYDSGPSQVYINMESARAHENPFSRIEFTHNAPDVDVTEVLISEGESALFGRRPRRIIAARISPLATLDYDINFSYGWRVGAQADGMAFDCQVSAVSATWREGYEELDIRLDGSESLWTDVYRIDNTATAPSDPDEPNDPPVVSAGADQTVALSDTVNLDGTVTDDGLPNPPATVTTTWSKQSGPGTATFGDANAVDTTVTFDTAGTYVLRLTASDSVASAYDELTVTVEEDWTPPLPGDETVYYGDMAAYLLWDGEHVFRTMNLQAASPTWEFVGTGITGTILDCQYFHPEEDVVGAWLLSTDGVWLCMDLLAVSPSWTNPLTLATVQAEDAVPASGTSEMGAMCHYWLQPGHLCVASTQTGGDAAYLHAYFRVTDDYGQTWTTVDMTDFTYTANSFTRGYSRIGPFGMACFRSEPIIWAARYTARSGTSNGANAVFKSTDGGLTWTKEYEFSSWVSDSGRPAILHPFPSITDPTYVVSGVGSGAVRLYRSTDAWDTATDVGIASGYAGAFGYGNVPQRPNKRTDDNTHLIMLWNVIASSTSELLESFDQGATWSLLEGSLSNGMVTPNGWPPDVDQWVLIDHANSLDTETIRLTLDNFSNLASKTGDLSTVLATLGDSWNTSGQGGGFALPRVGANA